VHGFNLGNQLRYQRFYRFGNQDHFPIFLNLPLPKVNGIHVINHINTCGQSGRNQFLADTAGLVYTARGDVD
jgi:hypothetical protein